MIYDAIIISDIHLGSPNCNASGLIHLLKSIKKGTTKTRSLILNGDVFDSINLSRLDKKQWKILTILRKISKLVPLYWIVGNHDECAEMLSPLLGVVISDQEIISSGDRRIFITHGHRYDRFIGSYPRLTWFADAIYHCIQWIDPTHTLAKRAKLTSKTFLRCSDKIMDGSIEDARRFDCDVAICGHTHHAVSNCNGPIEYHNSGCWTDKPGTYLTIKDGQVKIEFGLSIDNYSQNHDEEV